MKHVRPFPMLLVASACLTAGAACADPVKIAVIETLSGPQAASGLGVDRGERFGEASARGVGQDTRKDQVSIEIQPLALRRAEFIGMA